MYTLESKGIRLDVYVTDEEGTVYNIEMQQGENINLAKRTRYYQGNIDLDWIQKGEDYRKLNKSFIIFICTFDPFKKGRHIYTFKNICLQDTNIILGDETEKIFLCTQGIINDVDEEMLEFLEYMEHTTDQVALSAKGDLVKVLHKKVNEVKTDQRMEVEWMTLLERDREKIEQGRQEGREEGIEIGLKKGARQTAKNLLDMGLEIDKVAIATGLTKEEVEEIVKQ